MNALEITNLTYHYHDDWTRKKRTALRDLNLTVLEGETFGFLGHNGAGKTTAIKAILGLTKAATGSIRVFDNDSTETETRALIGYLPEQPYFYDNLRVSETMELYATLTGIQRHERARRISVALGRVGMTGREHSKMRALSKGLMQRVAMAQAIVADPKLLILDEPFSGLDPIGRKEFRELILQLKNEGRTIFMSSHILSDVESICDRASILVKGELKAVFDLHGPRAQLSPRGYEITVRGTSLSLPPEFTGLAYKMEQEDFLTRFFYTEKDQAEKALLLALHSRLDVSGFNVLQPSLEDAFVSLTKGIQTTP